MAKSTCMVLEQVMVGECSVTCEINDVLQIGLHVSNILALKGFCPILVSLVVSKLHACDLLAVGAG